MVVGMRELPENMEGFHCFQCDNVFYIEHIGELQELNLPQCCPYCAEPFEVFLEEEG